MEHPKVRYNYSKIEKRFRKLVTTLRVSITIKLDKAQIKTLKNIKIENDELNFINNDTIIVIKDRRNYKLPNIRFEWDIDFLKKIDKDPHFDIDTFTTNYKKTIKAILDNKAIALINLKNPDDTLRIFALIRVHLLGKKI